jgi:hypothetical protein
LLRHAWIYRNSDEANGRGSSNFNLAVEEVKQWNKALRLSENNLRVSTGSDSGPPLPAHLGGRPERPGITAKGPLVLAKPRPLAESFGSPELAGTHAESEHAHLECMEIADLAHR